ncbi:uncharacterized protein [Montipora capricornis]|uniref:uncharacterized protein isoform X1 n=1 Tax=Montipora capricornis TaxID=246305 RepID=UPI0035F19581
MNVSNWKEDGYYWIDPASDGTYLKVFCDMTTDGGAWLLASKFVMQNSTPPAQAPLKTSYRGIASNQMLLTKTAMNQLRTHMNFTQLRFHCKKQTTGRTFHITTAANSLGEAVVQYFSGQTDVLPYACGSFVKMNDDNSRLAEKCHEWGNSKNGKWGHVNLNEDRLYNHPAFVERTAHWLLPYNNIYSDRFECDDNLNENKLSSYDFWEIYAR